MIYGIGIDIVEINRIEKIVKSTGNRLAKRILSSFEWEIYCNRKYSIRFLAKRFVAKEAVAKAFGVGIRYKLAFNQVEISNDKLGKPVLNLFSYANNLAKKLLISNMHITLSDSNLYACAVAVFER